MPPMIDWRRIGAWLAFWALLPLVLVVVVLCRATQRPLQGPSRAVAAVFVNLLESLHDIALGYA